MAQIQKRAIAATLALIVTYEGYSHRAYFDPVGIPTICRGHTAGVHMGDIANDDECAAITEADLTATLQAITVDLPNLPPEVLAATADFCYNVGISKCKSSTLWRYLKAGRYRDACNEFPRWVYASGKKLQGLVNRRESEKALCLKGVK